MYAGTKEPEDAPSSNPDPPKRGRGRPRGSRAAASSAAAASASPAGDADAEGLHGRALEPAGPAQDDAHVHAPQTRRRRTASVSQATGAATGADDVSTAQDDDRAAAVQSEAPKSRRGRSRSSVSQLKQVTRTVPLLKGVWHLFTGETPRGDPFVQQRRLSCGWSDHARLCRRAGKHVYGHA